MGLVAGEAVAVWAVVCCFHPLESQHCSGGDLPALISCFYPGVLQLLEPYQHSAKYCFHTGVASSCGLRVVPAHFMASAVFQQDLPDEYLSKTLLQEYID